MKFVIDANGNIVKGPKGGVMVDAENGKEPYEFDVFGSDAAMAALRTEAKEHRTKKAEYKAIIDTIPEPVLKNPKGAEEALITVSTLGEKHEANMIKVKGELEQSYKAATDAANKTIDELRNQIFHEKVVSKFATSKALEGTIFNKNREIAISHYKGFFSVDENGNLIGKAKDGATIYSKENPGKPADFDECINHFIESDPNKESLKLPSGQKGTATTGTRTGTTPDTKSSIDRIKAGLAARTA